MCLFDNRIDGMLCVRRECYEQTPDAFQLSCLTKEHFKNGYNIADTVARDNRTM